MKLFKKVLSLFLVMCMLLGLMPARVSAVETGETGSDVFYSVLHLDAGRKYIKPEIIKQYLDDMAELGYNQLELYLSDNQGFRFLLDDTTITTKSGVTYDLLKDDIVNGGIVTDDPSVAGFFRPSKEEELGLKYYLTQDEMTDIIQYANKKGIEIVPAINMPGHMGAILRSRPDAWRAYEGSTKSSLNVENTEAVEYTLAILQAYADYFKGQGCKYFSIGADEYGYDIGKKTADIVAENGTLYNNIVNFMNQCADIIIGDGMTPRAFSDFFTTGCALNKNFEVYVWQTDKVGLQGEYKVINTSDNCYYALGSSWYDEAGLNSRVESFDPMTVSVKGVGSASFASKPDGAMMCIWCDRGYYDDEENGADGGVKLYEHTQTPIATFANALKAAGYISDEKNINLSIGESYGPITLDGKVENLQIDDVVTYSLKYNEIQQSGTAELSKVTSLTGGEYLIGNGTNFLTVNSDGSLGNTTDAAAATQWTVTASGGSYTISYNGKYLHWNGTYGAEDLVISDTADNWSYDSAKGFWQQGPAYDVILWFNGTWKTWYSVTADIQGHPYSSTVTEGDITYTTEVTFTGAKEGSASIELNGTNYTFIVSDGTVTPETETVIETENVTEPETETEVETESVHTVHIGGIATCHTKAICEVCGEEYGEFDSANHDGETEIRGYKSATQEEEGYTGDTYCMGCDTVIKTGTVIPKITESEGNVVKDLMVGEAYTIIQEGNYTEADLAGFDNNIASVTVNSVGGVTAIESFDNVNEVVIGNGTYYLTYDGTNLGSTTDISKAVKWTVAKSNNGIQLKTEDGNFLSASGWDDTSYALTVVQDGAYLSNWSLADGLLKNVNNSYITLDATGVGAGAASAGVGAYSVDSGAAKSTEFTFTAQAVGSTTFILSGTTYTMNVHQYEWKHDATHHWQECIGEGCTQSTERVAHSGGEATCISGAICETCGVEYGIKNPENHVGEKELRGKVEATPEENGYSGDLYCLSCNQIITRGHETVYVEYSNEEDLIVNLDETKTITREGFVGENGASYADEYISYMIQHKVTYPDAKSETAKVTDLKDGKYLIGNGTNFLTVNSDGSLGNTTDAAAATQWTVTASGGSYTISCNGKYLHWNGSYGEEDLALSDTAENWSYDSAKGFWQQGPAYDVLLWFNGTWKTWFSVTEDLQGNPYTVETTQGDPVDVTEIIFTGLNIGSSDVKIGDTMYHVVVPDPALVDVTLTVDYYITNGEVTGNQSGQSKMIINAAQANVENGVPFSTLVDETGKWDWSDDLVFWKGTRLVDGKHQGGTGSPDCTLSGDDFKLIRYWNGSWSISTDGIDWESVNEGDQIVAYFLQHTEVTTEIDTDVVDWGYTTKDGNFDGGTDSIKDNYVLLDYNVKYPDGTVNPSIFPRDLTLSYHDYTDDTRNNGQVIHDGGDDSNRLRRVGMSAAVNSSSYEVYMITVTRSSDTVSEKLQTADGATATAPSEVASGEIYKGTEYVAWAMTEEDAVNSGLPKVSGLGTREEGKLPEYDAALAGITDYRVGGEPIVSEVYIVHEQGLLITYYIRAKENVQNKMTVHYQVEGTDVDFYSYDIVGNSESEFNSEFKMDPNGVNETNKNTGLLNNEVVNNLGVTQTVTSVLQDMPSVPLAYRTGAYEFVKVTYDGPYSVTLYYSLGDNMHYMVVDFGRSITIDAKLFGYDSSIVEIVDMNLIASGDVANNGTLIKNDDNSYSYCPTSVITEPEKLWTFSITLRDKSSGEETTEQQGLILLPATTVYYEPTYMVNSMGASYSESWTGISNSYPDKNQQAALAGTGGYNYGYDAFTDSAAPNNSTELVSDSVGNYVKFNFVGTGIELYANTDTDTGYAMVILRDGNTGAVKRMITVDTHMENGNEGATGFQEVAAYNVPIVSIMNLEHGNYSVEIRHIKKSSEDSDKLIKLDGFRVYNTLESDDNVYGITAGEIYDMDGEKDPVFVELRDAVLAKVTIPDSYLEEDADGNKGQYADEIASEIMDQVQGDNKNVTAVILENSNDSLSGEDKIQIDYLDNGPKNEIYLKAGQSLSIAYDSNYDVQIGLKALTGEAQYNLGDGTTSLSTGTDMYYRVAGDGNISVSCESGILSITKLKLIPKNGTVVQSEPVLLPVSAQSLMYSLMTLGFAPAPPAGESNAKVEINGCQISTTAEGFRIVYSLSDIDNEVESVGLVYGLADYATESDMVVGSTNSAVYNYAATDAGKLAVSYSNMESAQSYAMTMEFIKTASFFSQKLNVRAYAKLSNGQYVYSDVQQYVIYDVADYLYQNQKMSNFAGHDYLFNEILSLVNPSYERVEYDFNHMLTKM